MFDWFKKKKEAAPDPEAEKMAAQLKEQQKKAELESKLNHQLALRDRADERLAKLTAARKALMDAIRGTADPAEQRRFAGQVGDIDEEIKAVNGELGLARSNIRKIRQVQQEMKNIGIVKTGNVSDVVDLTEHAQDLRDAGETAGQTSIGLEISRDANNVLLEGIGNSENEQNLDDILREAHGTGGAAPLPGAEPERSPAAETGGGRPLTLPE